MIIGGTFVPPGLSVSTGYQVTIVRIGYIDCFGACWNDDFLSVEDANLEPRLIKVGRTLIQYAQFIPTTFELLEVRLNVLYDIRCESFV